MKGLMLIILISLLSAACAHQPNCECGSTTPVEETTASIYQFTPSPTATPATSSFEAPTSTSTSTSTIPVAPVVPTPVPTATPEVISIDASAVLISGNHVTIQDDRFAQLVLSCTGPEYTEVAINIVLRRAYVAPSLVRAGCKDFYFLTARGLRSQTFHWPE